MITGKSIVSVDKRVSPSTTFIQHIEHHAQLLRRYAGSNDNDQLNVELLVERFRVQRMFPNAGNDFTQDECDEISQSTAWSGLGTLLPDKSTLVILNPNQSVERMRSTLMEEICHIYYQHAPSLRVQTNARNGRQYNSGIEQEAYWTGAAALLPRYSLARELWKGCVSREIALTYGVSEELVCFRAKILHLWNEVKKNENLLVGV